MRDMRPALERQVTAHREQLITRGVSLEPTVEGGLQDLAQFGAFDEVSAGGNWTNSEVVKYLGGDMSGRRAGIPQVVLLDRDVTRTGERGLVVGAERELGRHIGVEEIDTWVRRGSPIPTTTR